MESRPFPDYITRALSPLLYVKGAFALHVFYLCLQFASSLIAATVLANITNLAVSGASLRDLLYAAVPMVVILAVALVVLAFHIRHSTSSILRHRIMFRLYQSTIERVLFGDDSSSAHTGIGKKLTVLQGGISDWANFAMNAGSQFACGTVFFLCNLVYLGIRNPSLLPAAIAYVLITWLLVVVNQRAIRPIRVHRRQLGEEYNRRFARTIMEKMTVLFSGAAHYEMSYLTEQWEKIKKDNRDLERKTAFTFWWTRYLLDIARLATTLWICYQIIQGGATPGDIVAVGLIFGILSGHFQQVLDSYQTLSDASVQMERLWNFLDPLPRFERLHKGGYFSPNTGEIRFENVTYGYPGSDRIAISDFSLVFEGGKKTALIGRSGAGKSTVVKLLLGLLEPKAGRILVDGQNLMDIRLDSYFPHIGYLAQEPSVFDGTIRENLAYWLQQSPDEAKLAEALEHARCDFIEYMPHGLDTEIGERGVRLSGGERQRLAIARIFLRNPEILVLDEPTSALDSFSESAITEALHNLFENKTVIVVAHRLQTVKEADAIVVLGPEGILEKWTHESLLASDGEYSRMVDLQSGKILDETTIENA